MTLEHAARGSYVDPQGTDGRGWSASEAARVAGVAEFAR